MCVYVCVIVVIFVVVVCIYLDTPLTILIESYEMFE